MNEDIRLSIQLVLAKNFIGVGGKIPSAPGYRAVREALRGSGLRRNDVAEARKELGIQSEKLNGEYWWVWGSERTPEDEWSRLSEELWRKMNERKGH